ncbi:hypothetical protein D0T84_07220 [Dysgonomonas sp. 521]|uniref:hypothetical protein n=1 Tax=Dysgonomonas sp. 521 TaxID=2302932 RepID=UPI0013D220C3|nr:hypothetical protein [Dysgonomonas sp. 521]NDV94708.1 hypothetical protein [Dysgonomonas sp. 521]
MRIQTVSEKVFEAFSCNRWLLVHESTMSSLISYLDLKLIDEKQYWGNNTLLEENTKKFSADKWYLQNLEKFVISPAINEWHIVDAMYLDLFSDKLCRKISDKNIVYEFYTDLWMPIMSYRIYKESLCVRSYEYYIDSDGKDEVSESGEPFDFEKIGLQEFTSEYGYDCFFYPLAVMDFLGIRLQDIENAFGKTCRTYELPEVTVAKLIKLNEEKLNT